MSTTSLCTITSLRSLDNMEHSLQMLVLHLKDDIFKHYSKVLMVNSVQMLMSYLQS